jgi:hypothetical protein
MKKKNRSNIQINQNGEPSESAGLIKMNIKQVDEGYLET